MPSSPDRCYPLRGWFVRERPPDQLGDVEDLGRVTPALRPVVEHDEAVRARDTDGVGAGRRRLVHPLGIDALADALFHPHPRSTCAATHPAFPVTGHLHGPHARHAREHVARRVVHLVVAPEVAGVVVREEGLDLLRRAEPPLGHQPPEQLRVVDDLVVPAVLRVLVAERVEAVRAVRDDLGDPRGVHRLDVLLGEGLEQELVAHPPGGVARAELPRPEDRERHPRALEQFGDRSRDVAGSFVERARASHPVEVLGGGAVHDRHVQPLGPVGPLRLRDAPRVRPALQIAEHRARFGGEARLAHHQRAAEVDDRVDVLDVHRAFLDARAARRARPHDVVVDHVRHQRDLFGGLARREHLQQAGALFE